MQSKIRTRQFHYQKIKRKEQKMKAKGNARLKKKVKRKRRDQREIVGERQTTGAQFKIHGIARDKGCC